MIILVLNSFHNPSQYSHSNDKSFKKILFIMIEKNNDLFD